MDIFLRIQIKKQHYILITCFKTKIKVFREKRIISYRKGIVYWSVFHHNFNDLHPMNYSDIPN